MPRRLVVHDEGMREPHDALIIDRVFQPLVTRWQLSCFDLARLAAEAVAAMMIVMVIRMPFSADRIVAFVGVMVILAVYRWKALARIENNYERTGKNMARRSLWPVRMVASAMLVYSLVVADLELCLIDLCWVLSSYFASCVPETHDHEDARQN